MKNRVSMTSIYISVFCLFLATSPKSYGATGFIQDPATLLGPKSLGRGTATVAAEMDHDAVFQNIASAAFIPKYSITGAYLGAGEALTASIVDTKSGPIGGALAYLHRDLKTNISKNPLLGSYQRFEDRAAVGAFGRLSDELAVGGTFKYAYRGTYDGGFPSKRTFNFDLGAKYLVSPRLAIGMVGQNLASDDAGLDARAISGGADFILMPNLNLTGQITKFSLPSTESNLTMPNADKLVAWALGIQYRYSDVAFRGGYSDRAPWETKVVALGLGYEVKGFSLDYSFEKGSSNGSSFYVHSFSLAAYL